MRALAIIVALFTALAGSLILARAIYRAIRKLARNYSSKHQLTLKPHVPAMFRLRRQRPTAVEDYLAFRRVLAATWCMGVTSFACLASSLALWVSWPLFCLGFLCAIATLLGTFGCLACWDWYTNAAKNEKYEAEQAQSKAQQAKSSGKGNYIPLPDWDKTFS